MALTSSSQGASATPATDLYGTLNALMTTWTFVETATLAQAGTTADVKVWRNSTTKVYVLIEVDDANARLRFRCSEGYDSGTHTIIHPCPGNQSNTAITPNANDSVPGSEDADNLTIFQAVSTTSKVGWVTIGTSAGGFSYVMGANDNEIVLTTSTSPKNWVHLGRIPAADNFSPATTIVFLGGNAGITGECVSWTMTSTLGSGNYRVSREPNQGAVSLTGAFCYFSETIAGFTCGTNAGFGGQPATAHKWLTSMAAYQVYLHNASTTALVTSIRSHLAKLPSMAITGHDTVAIMNAASAVGDTLTIDGTTYYTLSADHIVASNTGLEKQCRLMTAKSSAF